MDKKVKLSYSEDGKELASVSMDTDFLKSLFENFNMEDVATVVGKVNGFVKEQQEKAHAEYAKLVDLGLGTIHSPETE